MRVAKWLLWIGLFSFMLNFLVALVIFCLMKGGVIPFDSPPSFLFLGLAGSAVLIFSGGIPFLISLVRELS